jgi:uncharacterized membrane protein
MSHPVAMPIAVDTIPSYWAAGCAWFGGIVGLIGQAVGNQVTQETGLAAAVIGLAAVVIRALVDLHRERMIRDDKLRKTADEVAQLRHAIAEFKRRHPGQWES